MGDTDAPDFNKARGFLIGYSTLVLLLWFFGADFTKLKIMGYDIEPHRNAQHVWGVIAGINVYLWFRFYQRLPDGAFGFSPQMHSILDQSLIKISRALHYRKALHREREEDDGSHRASNIKLVRLDLKGHMDYQVELQKQAGKSFALKGPQDFSYPWRAKIVFTMTRFYENGGTSSGGLIYEVQPTKKVYCFAVIYSFFKGSIIKSWFTDNVWPLILGGISTVVFIGVWVDKNYIDWCAWLLKYICRCFM